MLVGLRFRFTTSLPQSTDGCCLMLIAAKMLPWRSLLPHDRITHLSHSTWKSPISSLVKGRLDDALAMVGEARKVDAGPNPAAVVEISKWYEEHERFDEAVDILNWYLQNVGANSDAPILQLASVAGRLAGHDAEKAILEVQFARTGLCRASRTSKLFAVCSNHTKT